MKTCSRCRRELPVRNWGHIKRKRDEPTQRRALFSKLHLHAIDLAFDL